MTPFQSPPWRKLTELSGGKGVKAEWQDFPAELLAITNEQASAIPCNGRAGCYMNVVQHGPSDIVGICTSDTKQCDRRTLKSQNLHCIALIIKSWRPKLLRPLVLPSNTKKSQIITPFEIWRAESTS